MGTYVTPSCRRARGRLPLFCCCRPTNFQSIRHAGENDCPEVKVCSNEGVMDVTYHLDEIANMHG